MKKKKSRKTKKFKSGDHVSVGATMVKQMAEDPWSMFSSGTRSGFFTYKNEYAQEIAFWSAVKTFKPKVEGFVSFKSEGFGEYWVNLFVDIPGFVGSFRTSMWIDAKDLRKA